MVYLWRAVDAEGDVLNVLPFLCAECEGQCRAIHRREVSSEPGGLDRGRGASLGLSVIAIGLEPDGSTLDARRGSRGRAGRGICHRANGEGRIACLNATPAEASWTPRPRRGEPGFEFRDLARAHVQIGLCQSNGRSSARGATRPPSSDIQAARARHSANAAERLCL